jgi:hypothetical protein
MCLRSGLGSGNLIAPAFSSWNASQVTNRSTGARSLSDSIAVTSVLPADGRPLKWKLFSWLFAVIILTMTTMRDILRDAYLEPYFHPHQFAVKTQ